MQELSALPMIIYIDVNYDVNSDLFNEFEIKIKKIGLQAWKSKKGTRF